MRACRRISAATASPACSSRSRRCRPTSSRCGRRARAAAARRSTAAAYAELSKPSSYVKPMTYGAVAPGLFDAIVAEPRAADPRARRRHNRADAGSRGHEHVRQAHLGRDPVPRADPADHLARRDRRRSRRVAIWVTVQGLVALSVERVHHLHRPQAHRHHVHRARAGDAGARLCRRDHDARAAGARDRRSRRAICRPSITTRSSPPTARS